MTDPQPDNPEQQQSVKPKLGRAQPHVGKGGKTLERIKAGTG